MAVPIPTQRPPSWAEWRPVFAISVVIVALSSVPYLLAYAVPPDHVFAGVLVNPGDGNSYLAKMRQGLRGEWLFTLPYTAEPGAGVFLFTYYLFLGHLARWTGGSLDLVYHAARVLGGLALLLVAYAMVARCFDTRRGRLAVWLLYALGSGLGWVVVMLGGFPPDLWVAEAFPFLSIFTNPHFGLATALLLLLVLLTVPGFARPNTAWRRLVVVALLTSVLGLVLPIALLNVGLILAGVFVWRLVVCRPTSVPGWLRDWSSSAVFGVAALPWVVHAYALTVRHPVLAQWNAQNLTPSPPIWETAVAGGALLLLALPGAWTALRRRSPLDMALLIWLGLGVLALYAPFALQRRLSIGLWMPLVLLAGLGLRAVVWPRIQRRWRPMLATLLAIAVLPSNLLVYAATLGAVAKLEQAVFMTRDQADALTWLEANAGRALVAAPATMGLWVPARTDARVLYGHPFETVNAAFQKAQLEAFYTGLEDGPTFVAEHGVEYVLVFSSGGQPASVHPNWHWPIVYENATAVIYAP